MPAQRRSSRLLLDGLAVPAEWDDIEGGTATYVEVARAVARFEPVTMTANDGDAGGARRAARRPRPRRRRRPQRRLLGARHRADLRGRRSQQATTWMVDGGICTRIRTDANMARRILDLLGRFAAPLVPEGGAIHVDGQGTVLTTDRGRAGPPPQSGPRRCRAACDYLGAEKVLWLRHWTTTIPAATWTTSPASSLRASSRRSAAPTATTRTRGPYRTSRVFARPPTPATAHSRWWSCRCRRGAAGSRPVTSTSTSRTEPSHHAAVGDPADHDARPPLPGRLVVPVPTLELTKADGNIHCVTQQQPVA